MATDAPIKAIETRYKGHRFRSRTEARWAVVLETLGVKWEYEQDGYTLPSGPYLPDFWLPEKNMWLEVKPASAFHEARSFYLAGKMNIDRGGLKRHGHEITGPHDATEHGCHTDTVDAVVDGCFAAIDRANAVIAYIDQWDCHGTLVEIGYAKAKGKPIKGFFGGEVGAHGMLYDPTGGHAETLEEYDPRAFPMWFVREAMDSFSQASSVQSAFDAVAGLSLEERKCAELSVGNERQKGEVMMVCGVPGDSRIVLFRKGDAILRGGENLLAATVGPYPLFGPNRNVDANFRLFEEAVASARSARFEHGEAPR